MSFSESLFKRKLEYRHRVVLNLKRKKRNHWMSFIRRVRIIMQLLVVVKLRWIKIKGEEILRKKYIFRLKSCFLWQKVRNFLFQILNSLHDLGEWEWTKAGIESEFQKKVSVLLIQTSEKNPELSTNNIWIQNTKRSCYLSSFWYVLLRLRKSYILWWQTNIRPENTQFVRREYKYISMCFPFYFNFVWYDQQKV